MNKKQALKNGNRVATLTDDIEQMDMALAGLPSNVTVTVDNNDLNEFPSFRVDRNRLVKFIESERTIALEELHKLLAN